MPGLTSVIRRKLRAHVWFMSPSSVGPGGLLPLLSFYWQDGGLLRGRSVLSVTERLGYDKGIGLGVGQSTQIGPSVGHMRWLNGGWWCDSQVLRHIRTDISDGAWHPEHLTCLEEGLFGTGARKWAEGHFSTFLSFFVSVFYIFYHFKILDMSEGWQKGVRWLRWGGRWGFVGVSRHSFSSSTYLQITSSGVWLGITPV